MEKPAGGKEPQGTMVSITWTGWIPALWSIEAIVITGGLVLGALVVALMAIPAFDNGQKVEGWLFVAMSALCPLIPGIGAAHIHGVPRKLWFPRNRKPQG